MQPDGSSPPTDSRPSSLSDFWIALNRFTVTQNEIGNKLIFPGFLDFVWIRYQIVVSTQHDLVFDTDKEGTKLILHIQSPRQTLATLRTWLTSPATFRNRLLCNDELSLLVPSILAGIRQVVAKQFSADNSRVLKRDYVKSRRSAATDLWALSPV